MLAAKKCFHPEDVKSPAFLGKPLGRRLTECISCQPLTCELSLMCWCLCLHSASNKVPFLTGDCCTTAGTAGRCSSQESLLFYGDLVSKVL